MIDLDQLQALASDLHQHLGLRASVVPGDPHDIIVIDDGAKQVGLWFHPKRGYAGCDITPVLLAQTLEAKLPSPVPATASA